MNSIWCDSPKKKNEPGVPVVAQWLANPTRNHEVAGWICGLTQWVKDPALLWLWCRLQPQLQFYPQPRNFHVPQVRP